MKYMCHCSCPTTNSGSPFGPSLDPGDTTDQQLFPILCWKPSCDHSEYSKMDFFAPNGMSQSSADFEAASRSPASAAPPVPKRPSPISKGASRARVANKLSFLDLPGEIRNEVYALLLVFPDSLHIAGALDPQMCRRSRDRNRDLRMAWAQPSWSKYA
jgi:hypothetical protein